MKLTRNITLKELECKCGCKTVYDYPAHLAHFLQMIRDQYKSIHKKDCYIIITSACRCIKHNTSVGGAERSKHLKDTEGDAVDFYFINRQTKERESLNDILSIMVQMFKETCGIIQYKTFIHFDTRQVEYRDVKV